MPRLECASPTKDERKLHKGFDECHVQCVIRLVPDRGKSVMDVDYVARRCVFQPLVWIGTF